MHAIVAEEIIGIKASWESRRNKNIANAVRIKNGDKNKRLVTKFSQKQIDAYKLRIERVLLKRRFKVYYEIKAIIFKSDRFIIAMRHKRAAMYCSPCFLMPSLKRWK